jgi:predicted ATPase
LSADLRTARCAKHVSRRIVLTGGPGAGLTSALEIVNGTVCEHVVVLPEAAGIVFGGGFPRQDRVEVRRAGQRLIFHTERELETVADLCHPAIVLCDRGTVDGAAYWAGSGTLWEAVGTTIEEELARYATVIHLRTPSVGYANSNPLRRETAAEAARIDERIALAWAGHPHRFVVEATETFAAKAARTLEMIRSELPDCCRSHLSRAGELARAAG